MAFGSTPVTSEWKKQVVSSQFRFKSRISSLSLEAPGGKQIRIENLQDPIAIKFFADEPISDKTECYYYDTSSDDWLQDGVKTSARDFKENSVTCSTKQLTSFAIAEKQAPAPAHTVSSIMQFSFQGSIADSKLSQYEEVFASVIADLAKVEISKVTVTDIKTADSSRRLSSALDIAYKIEATSAIEASRANKAMQEVADDPSECLKQVQAQCKDKGLDAPTTMSASSPMSLLCPPR